MLLSTLLQESSNVSILQTTAWLLKVQIRHTANFVSSDKHFSMPLSVSQVITARLNQCPVVFLSIFLSGFSDCLFPSLPFSCLLDVNAYSSVCLYVCPSVCLSLGFTCSCTIGYLCLLACLCLNVCLLLLACLCTCLFLSVSLSPSVCLSVCVIFFDFSGSQTNHCN